MTITPELLALLALVQPPPAEYDYPNPTATVRYATLEQIQSHVCFEPKAIGCAYVWPDGSRPCVIIMPHGVGTDSMLYRHERAHCNGWVHTTLHSNWNK